MSQEICKIFEVLYKQIENKEDYFKYQPKILLKYAQIIETIPFQIYFKNQFIRLLKKDSIKKHLFLKRVNSNYDNVFKSIIFSMEENEKVQKEKEEPQNNQLSKEKEKSKTNKNKNKINDNTNDSHISNISFNMKIVEQKLEKKIEDIDEIISQKYSLLNQIINENNESNNFMLTYFDDINNLIGGAFEQSSVKFIFEIINSLSLNQDFYFHYNIRIKSEQINSIFRKYGLKEVNDIQIDFAIYNLKVIDLVNMLIYLFPNIIDFNNLKLYPFEKNMNFDKLIEMRKKYKKSDKRIDVLGEIGANVFSDEGKVEQLIKYRIIDYNIKYLIKNKKKEANNVLDIFKIKNNNNKIVLFLTNGDYSKFHEKSNGETKLKKNKINIILIP